MEGSQGRPRLTVFRSGYHIYAQIIDDSTGQTLAAASSLEENLRNFKPASRESSPVPQAGDAPTSIADKPIEVVEMAAEVLPGTGKGKGAKTEKAPAKAPAKSLQPQRGGKPLAQVKTLLPSAQKGVAKTPVEALAAIADNRKIAVAREVGKLVARRAKEKGVSRVVFDRGGYAYHGRVAALAEGARESGLNF